VLAHGTVGLQHRQWRFSTLIATSSDVLIVGNTIDATCAGRLSSGSFGSGCAAMVRDYIKWVDLPISLQLSRIRSARLQITMIRPWSGCWLQTATTGEAHRGKRQTAPASTTKVRPQGDSGAVAEAARYWLRQKIR